MEVVQPQKGHGKWLGPFHEYNNERGGSRLGNSRIRTVFVQDVRGIYMYSYR